MDVDSGLRGDDVTGRGVGMIVTKATTNSEKRQNQDRSKTKEGTKYSSLLSANKGSTCALILLLD